MTFFHLFLAAIIQGLTEFLPVSSSGHLILLPNLTGLDDQGQVIDVAVHVGTLFAVMLYFRVETAQAFTGLWHLAQRRMTQQARLAGLLIIATIPVILFGLFLHVTGLADAMRNIAVIGWTMLIFGVVLYIADQRGATTEGDQDWTVKRVVIMGLWQAIALIPGTSRSGACITGARFLGFDRESAARFAMLMSIPTIIASGTLVGLDAATEANTEALINGAIAAVLAFGSALLALTLMMRLLRSVSFTPYVIYRVILGIILLVVAYT